MRSRIGIIRCSLLATVALLACGLLPEVTFAQDSTIYRPDDRRPTHDDRKLAAVGIRVYESKRLKLYTDVDAEKVRDLPRLVDAIYPQWVDYFGDLPPARDGSDFQMTGYLIGDRNLFDDVGLVPVDLPPFLHGRHRGQEFWMNEQAFDYYRRHLVLHEATHCFMTLMPSTDVPVWYFEGMAELFATHRIDRRGQLVTRVMPENRNNYRGLGRISLIRDDLEAGRGRSLEQVLSFVPNQFLKNEPYAWSWAFCWLLDAHPDYQANFRKLGDHRADGQFAGVFRSRILTKNRDLLGTRWRLFTESLEPGYALDGAVVPESRWSTTPPGFALTVDASAGWQPTGVRLRKGTRYRITAEGRFTLATEPKPWISEPQGITILYRRGRPLGELIAAVDEQVFDPITRTTHRQIRRYAIGADHVFEAEADGDLYLRVNDYFGRRNDNTGQLRVTIGTDAGS